VAGAGAGVYASVRARRVKEAFTAEGLTDRWHALSLGAGLFRDEVAQGQAEAETQLRERFGLMPHGRPELTAAGPGRPVVSTGSTDDRVPVVSTGSTDDNQEGQH
jgi:hypothetical protein